MTVIRGAIALGTFLVLTLGTNLTSVVVAADEDSPEAGTVFIVDCGFTHQLQDDPIDKPNLPGQSHWHDFYGNPRTNAYSSVRSLKDAMVTLASATSVGTTAKFTLTTGRVATFVVGQQVIVKGVSIGGYNGTWPVTAVDAQRKWFKATVGPSGLGDATGGTAGDGALKCGQQVGELTYDTARYWAPSAYIDDGKTHITPRRMRTYYFGLGEDLPEGLQLIGGNRDAVSPAENPHVHWSCGQSTLLKTPRVDHPYDCTPFFDGGGQDFVDGPVGIVEMPWCMIPQAGEAPDSVVRPNQTKYPETDGGLDDRICDGQHTVKLIELSERVHLGETVMDPCGDCLAYNLRALTSGGCGQTCSGTFEVADININGALLVPGDKITVSGAPGNWNTPEGGYYTVTSVTWPRTFTASGLPSGLSSCLPGNCGATAEKDFTVSFTLAGGADHNGTTAGYYTLHADFFETWHLPALEKLELLCANGSSCTETTSNIKSNEQVDALGEPKP